MSKWGRKKRAPPPGFEYVEPTLNALEEELRERMNDRPEGKPSNEVLWPIHQINWQRSRYIYDLYYIHKRISREVYDYCIQQKLVDAALIAKWKKPGYERLCSTYVINTKNYPYGTVSICRVPRYALKEGTVVQDHTTGCRGCAPGVGGYSNIFGNKYGQRLAKIQILREERALAVEEAQHEVGQSGDGEGDSSQQDNEGDVNQSTVDDKSNDTGATVKQEIGLKRKRNEEAAGESGQLWGNESEAALASAEEQTSSNEAVSSSDIGVEERKALLAFQKNAKQG